MTPEEMDALAEQVGKDEETTAANATSGLSPKEQDALALKLGSFGKPTKEYSAGESAAAGFVEGATLGFDSELKAGVDAGYAGLVSLAMQHHMGKDVSDMTLEGVSEIYESQLQKYDGEMKKAQQDHPYWFGGGDMVGSGVSYFYGGGQASLAKTALVSGIHALGRSERKTLGDTVRDVAIGTGVGLGGDLIGRGLAIPVNKAVQGVKNMKGWTILEALGVSNRPARVVLRNHLKKTGRSVEEFADSLAGMTTDQVSPFSRKMVKEPMFRMQQSYDRTLDKVVNKASDVGDDIGKILQQADETLGTKIEASDLYTHLKREVVDPLSASEEPTKQELAQKVQRYLDSMFKESLPETITEVVPKQIPTGVYGPDGAPGMKTVMEQTTKEVMRTKWKKNFDLKGLHTLKNDVYDVIKDTAGFVKTDKMAMSRDVPAIDWQKQKIGSILNKKVDDIMESRILMPEEYMAYKSAKTQYSDLVLARKWLLDQRDKINHGALGKLRDSILARTMGSGMVAGGLWAAGVDPGTATAIALSLNMALASPGMPTTMAVGMKRIADAVSHNPELYSSVISRISAGAGQSSLALAKALGYGSGFVDLTEKPLARNTASVIDRKDSVLAVLEDHPLQKNLRSAIEENNPGEVKLWMGEILQDEEFSRKFVQSSNVPGEWDGYAVTPEAQQTVVQWAKQIRDVRKRKAIIEGFSASKKIPQELLQGQSGEPPAKQVIFKNMRNKLDKEY